MVTSMTDQILKTGIPFQNHEHTNYQGQSIYKFIESNRMAMFMELSDIVKNQAMDMIDYNKRSVVIKLCVDIEGSSGLWCFKVGETDDCRAHQLSSTSTIGVDTMVCDLLEELIEGL